MPTRSQEAYELALQGARDGVSQTDLAMLKRRFRMLFISEGRLIAEIETACRALDEACAAQTERESR